MTFKKYIDIERLGHEDNLDILKYSDDVIIVEEKVDGGNGCFWLEDDGIHLGSRNRDLTTEGDLKTFAKQRQTLLALLNGKELNKDYYYYVEWMQLHTIKYSRAPDVIGIDIRHKRDADAEGPGLFLGRGLREREFERLGIENVPIIWTGKSDELKKLNVMDLIPDSKYYDGKAEGIVIKNYCRKAAMGNHQIYAKVVREEFKELNKAVFGGVKGKDSDTSKIFDEFFTDARINKVILKQINEFNRPLEMGLMKFVPNEVIKDVLKEEFQGIFEKYRFIDFKELKDKVSKKCVLLIRNIMIERAKV